MKKATLIRIQILIIVALISLVGFSVTACMFSSPEFDRLPKASLSAASATPQSLYYGITDIEVTFNASKAETILRAWEDSKVMGIAYRSIEIDWFFIVFYSALLYSVTFLASNLYEGGIRAAGYFLAWGAVAAGICDIAENMFLLSFFNAPHSLDAGMVSLESFISVIKWILIINIISYLLAAVIHKFFNFYKKIIG